MVDEERKQKQLLKTLHLALRSEHSTNQVLLAERECLLQLIDLRDEQWSRHVSVLESRLEQMKDQEVKVQNYNAAKVDFLVDVKEWKAISYKKYAELTETDLEDSHTCIESLCAEIDDLKSQLSNGESTELKDLKLEIRKLKHGYRTLKSEKEGEVSEKQRQIDGLVCEKEFVWNQLKVMESEYVEEIRMLKKNVEEMEASILEKDRTMSKIKEEKDEMISRLNGEVQNLKNMLKEKGSGPLRSATKRPRETLPSASQNVSGQGQGQRQHSNRSQGRGSPSTVELTPRLFSANFKVPKLKNTTITSTSGN